MNSCRIAGLWPSLARPRAVSLSGTADPIHDVSRAARAPAPEGPVQQMEVRNRVHFHPSPVGKPSTTGTAHLIAEKLDRAVVNPVIVRLEDSRLLLVISSTSRFCWIAARSSSSIFATAGINNHSHAVLLPPMVFTGCLQENEEMGRFSRTRSPALRAGVLGSVVTRASRAGARSSMHEFVQFRDRYVSLDRIPRWSAPETPGSHEDMLIIDCHAHIYSPDEKTLPAKR